MCEVNSMTQEQEIVELLENYKQGKITYQEMYLELLEYPTKVKDNTIALYLLGGMKND